MNKTSVDKINLDNQNKIFKDKELTEYQSNTLKMNTNQINNIEKRLSETRKYLKIFIDLIPETIYLMDINGKIIVANTTFSKRLGLSSDSTAGLCVYNLLDKETADRRREHVKAVISSKKPLKIEDAKGNRIIDNNLYPIFDEKNEVTHIAVISFDITEQKKAQQIIKDSEKKLRNIVNTANEGILSMDENFLITFVNPKISEMLGYTPEEMVGKRVDYFMFEEDLEDYSDKMKSRKMGLSQKYEGRFKKKNGEELFTIVSATPLMDDKGNFKGSFAMFTDITERKKNEETIKQLNDNLKLLNKILRHDISNDLTVVSIALEMIKTENIEFKNKAFNAIQRSVDLIEKIRSLESTMDFRNKLKTISIKQVINSLKKTYPNVTIKIDKDCKIMADEAFTSVLDNIVNNAIIHGKSDKIDIEIYTKKDICEIKIIDYGKGIPDEIKERIFEEGFSYGKTGGTGLGLYIVKKTIERYGGSIEVQDTIPHGATFIVKLKKCKHLR